MESAELSVILHYKRPTMYIFHLPMEYALLSNTHYTAVVIPHKLTLHFVNVLRVQSNCPGSVIQQLNDKHVHSTSQTNTSEKGTCT